MKEKGRAVNQNESFFAILSRPKHHTLQSIFLRSVTLFGFEYFSKLRLE